MTFAAELLGASGVFHLHHLRASNHAQHVVLQAVYEKATQHADAILEQVLALQPQALDTIQVISVEVASAPQEKLDVLLSLIQEELLSASDEAYQKVLQDALADFRQLSYQLRLAMK